MNDEEEYAIDKATATCSRCRQPIGDRPAICDYDVWTHESCEALADDQGGAE